MESCDVCQNGVVIGIIHRIGQAVVCHDCRNALVASYGEEVGYTEAAQQAVQADVAQAKTCHDCGRDAEPDGYIDHAPYCRNAA